MPEFFSYDPLTGVKREFDYEEDTNTIRIHSKQDMEPMLRFTQHLQNTGEADQGIKRGFWKYAELPPIVQLQMKQKGIDIYSKDPAMIERMLVEIDENYKKFKATTKVHRVVKRRRKE